MKIKFDGNTFELHDILWQLNQISNKPMVQLTASDITFLLKWGYWSYNEFFIAEHEKKKGKNFDNTPE